MGLLDFRSRMNEHNSVKGLYESIARDAVKANIEVEIGEGLAHSEAGGVIIIKHQMDLKIGDKHLKNVVTSIT